MWFELAELGVVGLYWAYNEITKSDEPGFTPEKMKPPVVDEGDVYALAYGRCRVRRPVLGHVGPPQSFVTSDPGIGEGQIGELYPSPAYYGADMLWEIGYGFDAGTNRIISMYANDFKLRRVPGGGRVGLDELVGNGDFERDFRQCVMTGLATSEAVGADGVVFLSGEVEFLNGSRDQQLTDPGSAGTGYAATTLAGERMGDQVEIPELFVNGLSFIPGYRGRMLVYMTRVPTGQGLAFDDVDGFFLGSSPRIPTMSFEVWNLPGAGVAGSAVVDAGDGAIEAIDVVDEESRKRAARRKGGRS